MKNTLIAFLFLLVVTSCGNKSSEMTSEEKIAGTDSKTWQAKRETDASGDKDKLTKAEKNERITFSRNGNVQMGDEGSVMNGQWSLEGTNLKLHFAGENVTENFVVLELNDDMLKLKAGDGSEMTMKPD
ncbi:MAG: lipocalin family protein [Chryseolinea sp.]